MKILKLVFLNSIILPILFLSCNKENVGIPQSEIIFEIPVKGDTILEYTYDKVMVYPNPFNDWINIQSTLPDGDSATIQLTDANGEFMSSVKVSTSVWTINTEDYPEGVYYIEVLFDGYVDRAKILKFEE